MFDRSDRENLERVYRAVHDRLIAYLTHRGLRLPDAEDAVQEAFCRLINWLENTDRPARGFGFTDCARWLFKTVRNLAVNFRRDQKHTKNVDDGGDDLRQSLKPEDCQPAAWIAQETELRAVVSDKLAKLSDKERQVLTLTYWDESTQAEQAARLGLSSKQVQLIRFRAEERLRRTLAPLGDEDSTPQPADAVALRHETETAP